MSTRRLLLSIFGAALVVGAAGLLLVSVASTSTARLTASTSGSGVFSAGTVDLERADSAVRLLFDADGLLPGDIVSSCVALGYEGTVAASVRLHATSGGGSGLEDFVDLRLGLATTGDCPDPVSAGDGTGADVADLQPIERAPADPGSTRPLFDGPLGQLWRAHPDYDRGLALATTAEAGDQLVLVAEAELRPDPAAGGRTTEFVVTIEARP